MTESQASNRLKGMIAILRGLGPQECLGVTQALYDEGFRLIEIPLNSPEPLKSIEMVRKSLPADCLIGAGTVLTPKAAEQVKAAGGELIVMPHGDTAVIRRAKELGMLCAPGVATPTEAFAALDAGADALKLFPAEQLGPKVLKAWRAVLPRELGLLPVGGITPDNMDIFLQAGASGFGLGSALYKPGQSADDTRVNARKFQQAWKQLTQAL
ncbi:2-dehydro-3-deoxy-6-phosphogalactonate aldolase [Comamonas fluminis]|uniref:2-dehydro-3-deoxy-6-phosphogalactonate aldolase n=1 Tax=Comamonas fluminis TaxID=2796366 RepID=UPI001C474491|nr:2-dehydro-3-deoxy-6-phosphogalactonate aldolase [Comamonas fluminis]